MGQTIVINGSRRVGEVLVLDTNRSLAGQDGEAYTPGHTAASTTFPARLAERLFEADALIDRVHVMSNNVSISREGGWNDDQMTGVSDRVESFFLYYP